MISRIIAIVSVVLLRLAPRNAAGKGKTFRVIEVLRNVRVAEYGLVHLGVLATNVLPIEGYASLSIVDVWILGYQEVSHVSPFPLVSHASPTTQVSTTDTVRT